MAYIPNKIILDRSAYQEEITTTNQLPGRVVGGLNMRGNEGVDLGAWIQSAIDNNTIIIPPDVIPVTITADNGLYLSTDEVRLGGTLIEITTVNTDGFDLNVGDSTRGAINWTGLGLEVTTLDADTSGGVGAILQRTIADPTNKIEYTPYNLPTADPGSGVYQLTNDGSGNFTFTTTAAPTDIRIYTDDGTLTGTRLVTMSTYSLTFTGDNKFTAGNGNTLLEVFGTGNTVSLGDINGTSSSVGLITNDSTGTIKIGDIIGGANNTYVQADDTNSIVNSTNEQRFVHYGSGTYTGTAAYILGVDATGNITEETIPPGGFGANIYNTTEDIIADRSLGLNSLSTAYDFRIKYDSSDANGDEILRIDPQTALDDARVTWSNMGRFIVSVDNGGIGIDTINLSTTEGNINLDSDEAVTVTADTSITLTTNPSATSPIFTMTSGAPGSTSLTEQFILSDYGINTYTGTATYMLAVDASGNVIEEPLPSVSITASEGLEKVGSDIRLGHVATGSGASDFTMNRYLYTAGFDLEIGTTGNANLLYVDGSTGRIGIGTASPEALLNVSDPGPSNTVVKVSNKHITTGDSYIWVEATGTNAATYTYFDNPYVPWSLGTDQGDGVFQISAASSPGTSSHFTITSGTNFIAFPNYGGGTQTGTATYWLGVDVNGNITEEAIPGGAQNLWLNMDADSGGPVAANTTTDTFTFVGGTGISTAISGDTVVITNTGAGAVTTASEGLQKVVNDVQLGGTVIGGGVWNFTATRYLYTDTFDFGIESDGGENMWFDATNGWNTIGRFIEPDAQLHIMSGSATGGITNANIGGDSYLIVESLTTDSYIELISDNALVSGIWFGDEDDAHEGRLFYDNADNSITNEIGGTEVSTLLSTGQLQLHTYGTNAHTGTATYLLAVDASGNVIEEGLGGGGALVTASEGLIAVGTDVQLGNTSSGTGTHDFTADRFIYQNTFDLTFETSVIDLLHLDATNNRIGVRTSTPDGSLHVFTGNSGATADADADDLIVENSTDAGISVLSGSAVSDTGSLYFGTSAAPGGFKFQWAPFSGIAGIGTTIAGGSLSFLTDAATTALTLKSTQQAQLNGYGTNTYTGTATYLLGVDVNGNIIEEGIGGGGGDPDQDLWHTIVADTGSTTPNTITDTLTFTGGTDITTSIAGDIVTIDYTGAGGADTTIYDTDGTLTGNRLLEGDAYSLEFQFVDSGNTMSTVWQDDNFSNSVTDGTYTMTHSLTAGVAKRNTLEATGPTSSQLLRFNNSGNTNVLRNTYNASGEEVVVDLVAGSNSPSGMLRADNNVGDQSHYRVNVDSIGGVNLFAQTQNVNDGVATVGQVATLKNASDGRWEWETPVTGDPDQNIWLTINSDSGSTAANTTTDTLTITGGTDISTSIVGDTVTVDFTGSLTDTNLGNADQTITNFTRDIDLNVGKTLRIVDSGYTHMHFAANQQYIMMSPTAITQGFFNELTNTMIGSWDGGFDPESSGYRRFKATDSSVGIYSWDTTNAAHVELDYANDTVELLSDRGANESSITLDGAAITSTATNGTNTTSVTHSSNTPTLTINTTDGTDTATLVVAAGRQKMTGSWVDTEVVNDTTSRSSDNHNYAPTDLDKKRRVRYNCTGFHYLTGLSCGQEDGMIVEITNVGAGGDAFNVSHDSSSSTASNRFYCPFAAELRVNQYGTIICRYDGVFNRWLIISAS